MLRDNCRHQLGQPTAALCSRSRVVQRQHAWSKAHSSTAIPGELYMCTVVQYAMCKPPKAVQVSCDVEPSRASKQRMRESRPSVLQLAASPPPAQAP